VSPRVPAAHEERCGDAEERCGDAEERVQTGRWGNKRDRDLG
jgi:hypothetical protein